MKQTLHTALILLLLLVAQAPTLADGKVFARVGPDPTMPDQQALIHFDGKVQTLAIETRFEGDGTDFAWVVPLPSIPEISAATTGLFPTLRAVFAPRLADPDAEALVAGLVFQLLVALIIVLWASGKKRRALDVVILVGVLVLPFALLPALGKARGGAAAPAPAVTVHERKIVGDYETATISSESADALTSWLAENGFQMLAQAGPVIAEYVKDGWVFVATRLSREAQSGASTPHPLVFRFETNQCIYPMRLTGLQNRPLALDLYVFGSGRGSAPGMTAVRCDAAKFKDSYGRGLYLTHSGLASLVGGAKAGTRLTGVLSPEQMRKDVPISFGRVSRAGGSIYSEWSAHMIAANLAVSSFIAVVVVTALRLRRKGRNLIASVAWLGGPVLAAIAVGAGLRFWLPTTDNVVYGHPYRLSVTHRSIAQRIDLRIDEEQKRDMSFVATPQWIRGLETEFGGWDDKTWGEPSGIRWEDSPGNFIVRGGGAMGLEYVWYGHDGSEQTELLFFQRSAPSGEDQVR
jgi:uncharacterized membrane protein YoaK (UPF0700 family)